MFQKCNTTNANWTSVSAPIVLKVTKQEHLLQLQVSVAFVVTLCKLISVIAFTTGEVILSVAWYVIYKNCAALEPAVETHNKWPR